MRNPNGRPGQWWPQYIEMTESPACRTVCFLILLTRDNQTKQIQENLSNVEKHFGDMCQLFAAYVRKTARLRDKADLLVRAINVYADTETPNLKRGMKHFSDQLAKIEDYRQAEVRPV